MDRSTATLLCTALVICGCVGGRETYNVAPFQSISSIEAFVGDYENRSRPNRATTQQYLSDLIWAYPPRGELIEVIQVRSAGPQTLVVRALDANGAEVKASTFENGKDFHVRNGAIHIRSWTQGGMTGLYPMGPMAVTTHTTVSLGLDPDGNAQQVQEELSAGVWIIVPFTGSKARGQRFARIKK